MEELSRAYPIQHNGNPCIELINLPGGLAPIVVSLGEVTENESGELLVAYEFPLIGLKEADILMRDPAFIEHLTATVSGWVNEAIEAALKSGASSV